jgi:hypothetical protein
MHRRSGFIRITSFSDIPYLVLNNPVSYLFSVYQLQERSDIKSIKAVYSGFAPRYYTGLPAGNTGSMLDELPGSREEVLSAKDYFRGKVYLGERASKKIFSGLSKRKALYTWPCMHCWMRKNLAGHSCYFLPILMTTRSNCTCMNYSDRISTHLLLS